MLSPQVWQPLATGIVNVESLFNPEGLAHNLGDYYEPQEVVLLGLTAEFIWGKNSGEQTRVQLFPGSPCPWEIPLLLSPAGLILTTRAVNLFYGISWPLLSTFRCCPVFLF